MAMNLDDLRAGDTIPCGMYHSTVRPSLDFETASGAGFSQGADGKVRGVASGGKKGGLPAVGTPNYTMDATARVLCLYYDLKDGRGRRFWAPGLPSPSPLLDHVQAGGVVEAWNVTFELWVWNAICCRLYGWPPLPIRQTVCLMARARRYSLPGSLGKAARVLGTIEKDPAGDVLIRKLTRPHTPTKKRAGLYWTPADAPEDFAALYRYNARDVEAEDHAATRIPDLTPAEHAVWQLDQRINARGVRVDTETLAAARAVLRQCETRYTQELAEITAGAVGGVSEVAATLRWVAGRGFSMPSLEKDEVAAALKRSPPPDVRRVLEIREELGSANVKKLATLALQVSPDGRLRDQYTYCGADRTGRWSAGGVQLQNITAAGPKTRRCADMLCRKYYGASRGEVCPRCGSEFTEAVGEWTIDCVLQAIEDVRTASLGHVESVWGRAVPVLCGILRGLFIASEGCRLLAVDFSAIEAVAAACLTRCAWRIEVFSTHGKIYEQSAANASGIPFEEIIDYKKRTGSHHPMRKGIGKIRELAGGYGGWVGSWKNFGAEDYFPDDDAIKADVLKWRAESPEFPDMWGGQCRWCGPDKWDYRAELFGLEGAAISAILKPGAWFQCNDIAYIVHADVLVCRLPSGRFLNYHRPRLAESIDRLTRGPSYQITFEGYNSNSQKGPVGWFRLETYGARLFENVVQAACADIQAEALLRLDARGYPAVMHTHDEVVVELPHGVGTLDEMTTIMIERPTWAHWWPIRGAGWEHERYQKD